MKIMMMSRSSECRTSLLVVVGHLEKVPLPQSGPRYRRSEPHAYEAFRSYQWIACGGQHDRVCGQRVSPGGRTARCAHAARSFILRLVRGHTDSAFDGHGPSSDLRAYDTKSPRLVRTWRYDQHSLAELRNLRDLSVSADLSQERAFKV